MTTETWDARRARQIEDNRRRFEKLDAVVAAGLKLKLWAHADPVVNLHGDDGSRWVYVTDAEGLRFCITTAWNEDKLSARVGDVKVGPHRVCSSDVKRYDEGVPEATCSSTRSPEAIAKDLHRRLIGNVESIGLARRIRDEAQKRHAYRESLNGHLATLHALGYQTHGELPADRYYKAEVFSRIDGYPRLTVHHDGSLGVESFGLRGTDQLPALLALLRRA